MAYLKQRRTSLLHNDLSEQYNGLNNSQDNGEYKFNGTLSDVFIMSLTLAAAVSLVAVVTDVT